MSTWEAQRGDGGPGGQRWTAKGLEHPAEGRGLCPQGAGSGGMRRRGGAWSALGAGSPPHPGWEGTDWRGETGEPGGDSGEGSGRR